MNDREKEYGMMLTAIHAAEEMQRELKVSVVCIRVMAPSRVRPAFAVQFLFNSDQEATRADERLGAEAETSAARLEGFRMIRRGSSVELYFPLSLRRGCEPRRGADVP